MQPPSPQPNATSGVLGFSIRFWVLVALTGAGAGLGGAALMMLLRAVQHLAWIYPAADFVDAVGHAPPERRVFVLVCAGALAGLGRLLLRRATGGHGGELSEAIWFHSGRLPALHTFARAVLSIVTVAMGASLGREGALKQTGAAVASKLSDWGRLSPGQRRLLAACGAGAGMAAAYNVPFGGALFALEVLLGTLALPLVLPALATSLIATAVSWVFLPMRATYSLPAIGVSAPEVVWAAITAPLMGVASVVYLKTVVWADARKPQGWGVILTPMLVFAALGLTAIPFPQLLGNGKDLVQEVFTSPMGVGLVGVLLPLRLVVTAGCLGSGSPGGLFTPTMTYGALLGALLAHLAFPVWPGLPVGSCALIGAGAVLAATTQGPVSAVALTLELTSRVDAHVVPLMLAVAGASLVARALDDRSIYSARIQSAALNETCLAPPPGRTFWDRTLQDGTIVSAAARHGAVLERLLELGSRPAPLYVVDEGGRLVGEIRRPGAPPAPPAPPPTAFGDPWETATASDLAVSVPSLTPSLTTEEVERRFQQTDADCLPLVDAASGRLLGVVARNKSGG